MAYTRHSRPDSGLDLRVTVFETFQVVTRGKCNIRSTGSAMFARHWTPTPNARARKGRRVPPLNFTLLSSHLPLLPSHPPPRTAVTGARASGVGGWGPRSSQQGTYKTVKSPPDSGLDLQATVLKTFRITHDAERMSKLTGRPLPRDSDRRTRVWHI